MEMKEEDVLGYCEEDLLSHFHDYTDTETVLPCF